MLSLITGNGPLQFCAIDVGNHFSCLDSTFVKTWHKDSNNSSFLRTFTPKFNMFCENRHYYDTTRTKK